MKSPLVLLVLAIALAGALLAQPASESHGHPYQGPHGLGEVAISLGAVAAAGQGNPDGLALQANLR